MQMLGRIHRTGQVLFPSYAQRVADVPAQKRPAAVLANKMASLNANTTAKWEGALTAKDVPDFMNQYGDEIAAEIMTDTRCVASDTTPWMTSSRRWKVVMLVDVMARLPWAEQLI